MDSLVDKVWDWFEEHDLHDPYMQYIKMVEECGELAHELTRGNTDTVEVEDAIGDILVTVIGMCHHLNLDAKECLEMSYNEIKNRKGKVVNGSFVKSGE